MQAQEGAATMAMDQAVTGTEVMTSEAAGETLLPVLLPALALVSVPVFAAESIPIPRVSFGITPAETPQDVALSLQILFLLTILSLAPSVISMLVPKREVGWNCTNSISLRGTPRL